MKHDNTRHIVAKALFNSDEFVEFNNACKAVGVSNSGQLRTLANAWVNRRRVGTAREWPSSGPFRAMFPSRRVSGSRPMRL